MSTIVEVRVMMTNEERWENISILSDIRAAFDIFDEYEYKYYHALSEGINALKLEPLTVCSAFERIADVVDGDIDHLDRDDAMDLLYEIKSIIKGTERESDES